MGIYHRPCNLKDALGVLASGPVTIAAGCTDLFAATEAPEIAGPVLDVTGIAALRGITETPGGWRIGAATTWSDLIRADLPPAFDALKAAAREVGSVQIQNAATIAGNLCNASPAADGVPPLLILEAEVEIASLDGVRLVGLSAFLRGVRETALRPGEMVVAVHVPRMASDGQSVFLKLGARRYLVISIAMVAARVVVRGGLIAEAALAVGACSPVAQRLRGLEARLLGLTPSEAVLAVQDAEVAAELSPISDVRADESYRGEAAGELVRRALQEVAQ